MPVKLPEETESAPKAKKSRTFLFTALFIAVFLLFMYSSIRILYVYLNAETLTAPEGVIQIETADSPSERQLGLSGQKSIDENSGLLFIFDNNSVDNCFWMKEMNFPIDMVWMNENKEVITVTENVTPNSYPETFCPTQPAKYGLEIATGQASVLGIQPGVVLNF